MTPTTRTYHRNSALAWPRTAEYAASIEKPADHADAVVLFASAAAAVLLIAMALVEWLA